MTIVILSGDGYQIFYFRLRLNLTAEIGFIVQRELNFNAVVG
jgi:hypothetical protein